MTAVHLNRRNLLAAGGSSWRPGLSRLLLPARAKASHRPLRCRAGPTTPQGAATVERIGKGGFWMSSAPYAAQAMALRLPGSASRSGRTRPKGRSMEPQSHGATLTDKDGKFRLEMPQIIPIFGQPHGHLAYDSGEFKTVFLRPVMRSAKEPAWKRTSSFAGLILHCTHLRRPRADPSS